MNQVLIADDSPFMRRVLREILNEGGYQVISESETGLGAIEEYKKTRPDLVLMDYNMPKMNGIDAASRILNYDAKACIVMVTSIGGKKRILQALRTGVKNYVTKPFENYAFLATLKKVLGDKAPSQSQSLPEEEESLVIGSFFGQYLLQKGILKKEQLLQLMEVQSNVNRKIGQIAVDEGLLLPNHVENILKMQKRINKYFGQLAVQMGLMNSQQIAKMLNIQRETAVPFEEILKHENVLPQETIDQELQNFEMLRQEDEGVFNVQWVGKHVAQGNIYQIFIEQTLKLVMRLAGLFVMEGQYRFDSKEFISHGTIIRLAVSGDNHWSYMLNISEDLAEIIAEGMLDSDYEEQENENLCVEAANEFANIVCGNAIAKLDSKGIKLEITPPMTKRITVGQVLAFGQTEQVLRIPILVPEGQMELIIAGTNIFNQ